MQKTPSGLLIPGSARRGLTIHVPRGYEDKPTMVCRVPIGNGQVCGKSFYPGEESAWTSHLQRCWRQHQAEIHEASPRTRVPIIHDANLWDPELEEYMQTTVRKRMLEEGRLEMKPNERAGG